MPQVKTVSGKTVIREIDAEVLDGIGRSVFSTDNLSPRTGATIPCSARANLCARFHPQLEISRIPLMPLP